MAEVDPNALDAARKERLRKFLNEKWKKLPCEGCGVTLWHVEGMPSRRLLGLWSKAVEGDYTLDADILSFYWVWCGNCGNLRMVNTKVVDDWAGNHGF